MELCKFMRLDGVASCSKKPVKNSIYCSIHKFRKDKRMSKLCLCCGNWTRSTLQVCRSCGVARIRARRRYHAVVKPFNDENKRLRNIEY